MFLLFALLSAKIPFLTRTSKLSGSIPFWFIITKPFLGSSPQTSFLSSTIFLSFSSTKRRSLSTSFSRCSALE